MYFINAGVPGAVGKLNGQQIVSRQTWDQDTAPDATVGSQSILASFTRVRQVREGASTITVVNPMEPMHENGQNKWIDPLPVDQCCETCGPQKVVHY